MGTVTQRLRRTLGGKKAKSRGEGFERLLIGAFSRIGAAIERIPQGARFSRIKGGSLSMVPIATPFDFFAVKSGSAIFFDAKTIDANTFSHSHINQRQLSHLLGIARAGCLAGYLIHFQTTNRVFFFPAEVMNAIKPGQSLKSEIEENDGLFCGHIGDLSLKHLFGYSNKQGAEIT